MKLILSNASPDPIYEQIAKQIRHQILAGELAEGDELPSIRKLAVELRISVITTKRAYDELEREGFINAVAGKGNFVAAQHKDLMREKKMKTWHSGTGTLPHPCRSVTRRFSSMC